MRHTGEVPCDDEARPLRRAVRRARLARGGVNAQAIAAIENALLDVKGKSLNVPVHELLGGKQRDTLAFMGA